MTRHGSKSEIPNPKSQMISFRISRWCSLLPIVLVVGCGSDRPALAAKDSAAVAANTAISSREKRLQKEEPEEADSAVQPANYQPIPEPNPANVAVRVRAQVNGIAILDNEI